MKYLLAQPASIRFQWELDVCLTSIRSLDPETPIVLLFLEDSPSYRETVEHFRGRYGNLEIHSYSDERLYMHYPPTVRPFLMWKYLGEDKTREKEDYFQIDSDVIFREIPDFAAMLEGVGPDEKVCLASDCSGYLGWDYLISRQRGKAIVEKFAGILNISVEKIRTTPGVGAQWLITKPTGQLWYHVWKDSEILYDYLIRLDSDIQKWTAEMWAQLYNLVKFGWRVEASEELAFIRPTDPIGDWEKVKILHNAGVTGPAAGKLFFKGKYDRRTPFGDDLSFVDSTKAGKKYAEAVARVYTDNNV